MYKRVFLGIISSILIIGCNSEKPIPVPTLECKYLTDRDGVIYNKEDLFTGSCKTVLNFVGDYEFNGKTNEVRTYRKGLRDGVWAKYYKNGQLEYKGNARKGIIHGQYDGYYDNGQLKESGLMKDGYRQGEWFLYDNQGKLLKKELHKNKRLILYENY